ncbi:hypothetical protein MMC19_005337 [Ptychographa xylographoides]|nr:hypothetical protein [Ptychographa xylographoides]
MALDSEIDTLRGYFAKLCGTEHAKNQLFEDLLTRLEAQNHELQQEKLDHTRESHFNREVQLRERKLLDELRLAKARIERDAFILVLIDGDGMIFEDHYIQGGEEGGKEAASMLWGAVRDYVHQNIPGLPSDYKIVARVYANLNGLSDACNKAGIIDNPHLMREFARGFTGTKQLFDFIDVGSGKDRADDKVSELLKLYLYNCHCRHILFGCSHDNGYARLLEDVNDRTMPNHITLLEGVPFERELAAMKSRYVTTKFENLFRTTKINVYQQYQQPPQVRPPLSQPQSMPQLLPTQTQMQPSLLDGVHNGLQNGLQSLQIANSSQTPQQVPYQSQYQPAMDRTPSASTNNSAMNPMATTWANKAVAAAPPQLASPPPTPQPADNGNKIPRNRLGQRIDPVIHKPRNLELPTTYGNIHITAIFGYEARG